MTVDNRPVPNENYAANYLSEFMHNKMKFCEQIDLHNWLEEYSVGFNKISSGNDNRDFAWLSEVHQIMAYIDLHYIMLRSFPKFLLKDCISS